MEHDAEGWGLFPIMGWSLATLTASGAKMVMLHLLT
jgi:hypothetical protein